MTYESRQGFGPESTPRPLKFLILITIAATLGSAFSPYLQALLSLSLEGIRHLYLWQLFTYLFVSKVPGTLSFSLLLQLAFNMYLLWVFGSQILLRAHPVRFFALYFGSGIFAGLLALGLMSLISSPSTLSGSTTALYAVLVAWIMVNRDAQLLLFFVLPIKAYYLLILLIGANLLIDFSNRDWIDCVSFLGSSFFGYCFALISWREQGPFLFLRPFEKMVLRTLEKLRHLGKKRAPNFYKHSKIYDIHSGEPVLDDDAFMDAMLNRISLYGEDSLSPDEKKRMHTISARKNLGK
ncbi:MAG: rhomboid family intramembrane serine protease [Chlamydiota bacterium]